MHLLIFVLHQEDSPLDRKEKTTANCHLSRRVAVSSKRIDNHVWTHSMMSNYIEEYLIPKIIRMRDEGNKEYARDVDNVFANFERAAEFTDSTPEKAIMTYLIKHIDGISAHINGHTSQRENVEGRIIDAIVYLMLLGAMLNQEWEQVPF